MATFLGTNNSERLNGSPQGDRLQGFKGNDWLVGGLGADTIYGDDGNDILYAGENISDRIAQGEEPQDFANLLDGGDGDDLLVGSELKDREIGGDGDDLLYGYSGDDLLTGGSGNDALRGHGANDTLLGGSGRDDLHGYQGDDYLNGGSGSDKLYGWNDFKQPDSSNLDRFVGGSGDDQFILATSRETFYQVGGDKDLAIIEDLEPGDSIRLNGAAEDYSLEIDTMNIGDDLVMGTYINYNVYGEGETIGFVVDLTDLDLSGESFDFV